MLDATPYGLVSSLERRLVATVAASPQLYIRIGRYLRPELMGTRGGAELLRSAKEVYEETGNPPASAAALAQTLSAKADAGYAGVDDDVVDDVVEILTSPILKGEELEQVVGSVAELAKDRERYLLTQDMLRRYGTGEDFDDISDGIMNLDAIGIAEASPTVKLSGARAMLKSLKNLNRLPTGVTDVDNGLSGGLPNGALGIIMGGSGSGKSMLLSQIAAASIVMQKRVAYISLELPAEYQVARTLSPLIGWDTDRIILMPDAAFDEAEEADIDLDLLSLVYMESHVTPVASVVEWVKKEGPFDVICIDYLDLIIRNADSKKGGKNDSEYNDGKYITTALRNLARSQKAWVWTASQITRRQKVPSKNTPVTLDSVAGSMHKVRLADVVLGLNTYAEESNGNTVMMSDITNLKHRMGRSGTRHGPYFSAFEYGCAVRSPIFYLPEDRG